MDTIRQNFDQLAAQAKKDGVRLEMLVTGGESLKLGFQKRKLEKFESSQSQMAGLRVIDGASQGYAYTENLGLDALLITYKEALGNAKMLKATSEGPEIKLAKPAPVKDMSHLFVQEDVAMDKKMKVAEALEGKTLDASPKIQAVPYCGFSESSGFKRVLNTEGVDVSFKSSGYSGYAYALAKEGEVSKMDGDSFFARNFSNIDVEKVAKTGAERALSRLGARKLKTGMYPVIIDKEVMPSFITMIAMHLSAQDVFDGKSILKDQLGKKLGSDLFNLIDDPFDERGGSVRPFDSEGTPSQKTSIFENGVLKTYLTNLEYADKMNLPKTGHAARSPASSMGIGPSNLILQKGSSRFEEMLKAYPQVVVVTELNGGLHAGYKESTGDFSLPCEGFLYENGKLVSAVDQFVMSGNILDFIKNVEAVGADYNSEGNSILSPDVLIKSLSFAGE